VRGTGNKCVTGETQRVLGGTSASLRHGYLYVLTDLDDLVHPSQQSYVTDLNLLSLADF
jgi:hypothetical protein